jgi:3-methyladenine DNA glycosylase/8-oxoguanine DNA glycosylase
MHLHTTIFHPRITKLLTAIRKAYGTPQVRVRIHIAEELEEEALCLFPSLQQIENATEQDLRKMRFGYRAPCIMKTILQLHDGEASLHQLRNAVKNYCNSLAWDMRWPTVLRSFPCNKMMAFQSMFMFGKCAP